MKENYQEVYKRLEQIEKTLLDKLNKKEMKKDEFYHFLSELLIEHGLIDKKDEDLFSIAVGKYSVWFEDKIGYREFVGIKEEYIGIKRFSSQALEDIKAYEGLKQKILDAAKKSGGLYEEQVKEMVFDNVSDTVSEARKSILYSRICGFLEVRKLIKKKEKEIMLGDYPEEVIKAYFRKS